MALIPLPRPPRGVPQPPEPAGLADAAARFQPAPPPLPRPGPRAPLATPPDPDLAPRFGLGECLRAGVLPWRWLGGETVVLTLGHAELAAALPRLRALYGPHLRPQVVPRTALETAAFAHFGPALAHAAETRVPPGESCRRIDSRRLRRRLALPAAVIAALAVLSPLGLFTALFALAALSLFLTTGFKLAAALAALRRSAAAPPPLPDAALPRITLLIALYDEEDIAPRLIARLERLDYPRDRLDLILIVEAGDLPTRAALSAARLPPWMRVIVAPQGSIRTKPRALNLALDAARGEIIGVYDAEDAPAPDQLRKVAAALAAAPPRVACIQAVLDFYNPRKNWLSRCFTLEYALWFRLILPGVKRLGLPLPLGGTSVFLRRTVLDALGGWDAHNVTEDADLGIRLARHGYSTRMLDSVTMEEANCRALPWVRQRSRWIKGYLLTWLVHMRAPGELWRQLGPRGFLGFQVVFLGSLTQVLVVPVLWTLWTIPLGLGHPLTQVLPSGALTALAVLFLMAEVVGTALGYIALRRSGQRLSPLWLPTLHAYFPLGTLAALKGLAETLIRPFYWDKTRHGQFHDTV